MEAFCVINSPLKVVGKYCVFFNGDVSVEFFDES